MRVKRLDHIVLAVRDLQQAADRWAQTFGLRAEPPIRPEGIDVELGLLPLPDAQRGGAFLELAQPLTADGALARVLDDRGEGMLSISLEVDDLDAAVRELQAQGVPVSDPAPGPLADTRVARIPPKAGHGVAIQLLERS